VLISGLENTGTPVLLFLSNKHAVVIPGFMDQTALKKRLTRMDGQF
jgi:thiol:disulfide interchange protein